MRDRNGVDLGGGKWGINRRRRGRTICDHNIIYKKIIYISIKGVNWKKKYDDQIYRLQILEILQVDCKFSSWSISVTFCRFL